MTARRHVLLAAAAISAIAAGAPLAAQAQDQAQDAGEVQLAQATPRPPYMDRVVVTTTRSARALSENVGNIAVMDDAELLLIGPHAASEALNRLPGVNVQRGSGQEHLTAIRSPVLTGGAGAGSFLYLEEGVPLRAAGFANVNGLFEANEEIAAGIEAIRGPGGALYGSNAVHGVINFLVRGPETAPGNYLEASYGSFDRFTTQGWTSRTLDDQGSGYFVGYSALSDGGYRVDSGVDDQKITARFDLNRGRMTTKTIFTAVNINQETAGYTPDYRGPARRTNPNPEAYRDVDAVRWSTRIDVDADNGWTLSATPFARTNFMEFNQHFLPYGGTETNGHWSLGAQLAAYKELARGGFIIGTDIEYSEGFLREFQDRASFGAFPQGYHYDYNVDATVIAPYVHLDHELTERLRLEAGLRLEMTDYDYVTNIPSGVRGRFFVPADRSDDYETLTPNIGLAYDFDENTVGWVRYVRGARAPQTTDAYRLQNLQVVGEIDSETNDSIEAGVRGQRGPAQFELVGFYGYKKNFFFRDADGLNVTDGETESYGVEFAGAFDITDTLMLRGSGTLASHTYQFDRTVAAVGETIRSGDKVDTAPELLVNAQLVWTPVENFSAELAWSHVAEYFSDAENLRTYPGHDVFDLRARWQINQTLNVFGAVRNLFDTEYAERADYGFGSDRYFPGEGQAFQIGFGAAF